jgi:molybdate transport system substrate-binding protein
MKIVIVFVVLFFHILDAKSINIAVAANVSYAIGDLIKKFNEIYPETKVNVTLGSSGKLTAQIKNGAPYDLFLSANMDYPNALFKTKDAIFEPKIYAKGSLALLSVKQRNFKHGLGVLQSKLVKRIALANPKTAPYGKATKEALMKLGIYESIKSKLILGESISQTISYTMMAADLGIVAKSSLFSKKMKKYKKNIHWIEIDSSLYTPINQGMVLLKKASNNKQAKEFYHFILAKDGKNILKNYGYSVIDE